MHFTGGLLYGTVTRTTKGTETTWEEVNFNNLQKRTGILGTGEKFELTRSLLEQVGSLDKITFSNIPNNGYWVNNSPIVLADEYSHKTVNAANINTFLKPFASGADQATFEGLYKIACATEEQLESAMYFKTSEIKTVEYSYSKYNYTTIADKTNVISTASNTTPWPPKNSGNDGDSTVELDPEIVKTINGIYNKISGITINVPILGSIQIAKVVVTNHYQLLHLLRDTKVEIELTTTADGPCVVFWGLDVNAEVNN